MSIDIYTMIISQDTVDVNRRLLFIEGKMSKYKNPTYSLRIDYRLQCKVRAIAESEGRPISMQYERIVRDWITEYEQEHGEIPLPDHDPVGGGTTE